MVEDIHDPVGAYRSSLGERHAANTTAWFDALLRRSGVDEEANRATVARLRASEAALRVTTGTTRWWKLLRVLLVGAAAGGAWVAYAKAQLPWLMGTPVALALWWWWVQPTITEGARRAAELQAMVEAQLADAWAQMAPLNAQYGWGDAAALIRRTAPRIEVDPYFTNARLRELVESFGWNGEAEEDRSILFAHSGALNGNPFLVAWTLRHWMGTRTYTGSRTITWTERVRGRNGRWESRTQFQTLHASIERPFPCFAKDAFIIYGNEAAPDLSFSRTPNALSGSTEGAIGRWRMARAVKKLEAKARTLDSSFAVMANREFDALFKATDRDHEVQFRLLFTALAQQEMVRLLKDEEVGFGDNFAFRKRGMINVIEPAHLDDADLSCDPALFQRYELAEAREFFNAYHNRLFHALFFGLAPVLAIPLYQQHRSHADIYKDVIGRRACDWELEATANYHGQARFAHPASVTENILKTQEVGDEEDKRVVRVTANGFRGEPRVTNVSVLGRDGRTHRVPVEWTEYFAVRRESEMVVAEVLDDGADNPEADPAEGSRTSPGPDAAERPGFGPGSTIRRSIVSMVR